MGQFLAGVLLGLIAGFIGARFVTRRVGSAGAVPRATPEASDRRDQARLTESECERLRAELAGAERRAAGLEGQLEAARRRCAELEKRALRLEQEVVRLGAAANGGPVDTTTPRPPAGLTAPDGLPDDLKMVSGIGPRIEQTLNRLGIFHFRQIAALTPGNVAWLDGRLRFRGRIERERWIEQARLLATGGQTEFSRRYQGQQGQQQQRGGAPRP